LLKKRGDVISAWGIPACIIINVVERIRGEVWWYIDNH